MPRIEGDRSRTGMLIRRRFSVSLRLHALPSKGGPAILPSRRRPLTSSWSSYADGIFSSTVSLGKCVSFDEKLIIFFRLSLFVIIIFHYQSRLTTPMTILNQVFALIFFSISTKALIISMEYLVKHPPLRAITSAFFILQIPRAE